LSTELISGINLGHVVYSVSVLFAALVVSWLVRLITSRIKSRLRKKTATSLLAQIINGIDGPLAGLILLWGVFLAAVGLPPVGVYATPIRQGFTVLAIIMVTYTLIRVQGDALRWYVRRLGRRRPQAKMMRTMLPMARRTNSILLLVIGMLVIMDQLGIAIAPLVAGLGIAGLAVALALQGTLSDFFAGINILTDGSLRVGDYIELESGLAGYIDQIGWRTTRIRMLANNMIIIPNSRLASSIATNYNFPAEEMSVYLTVGVAYSSDLDHVERVTVEVAKEVMGDTDGSVEGYEPSIWFDSFDDSNITFWVVLRSHGYMEMWRLKHNFIKALLRRYNQEGIEISFPARSLYFKESPPPMDTTDPPGRRGGGRAQ